MDTNENNQEEYEALEGAGSIDERVLNTPAKEQKITIPTIDDGQKLDTFMQFNKSPQVKTEEGIVLDLAGEKATIDEEDFSEKTNAQLLSKVTGNDIKADGIAEPGAFLIIFLVSVGLFGFLLMNFKRSEELEGLKEEINKLKGKTNNLF